MGFIVMFIVYVFSLCNLYVTRKVTKNRIHIYTGQLAKGLLRKQGKG